MATDLTALQNAIKLLADAAVDTAAVASGSNPLATLFTYKNLIPDLMMLAPTIGELPAEAKALKAADYITLVEGLARDLSLTDAHAGSVVNASIDLLQELAIVTLPKVEALVAAVKAPVTVPAAP